MGTVRRLAPAAGRAVSLLRLQYLNLVGIEYLHDTHRMGELRLEAARIGGLSWAPGRTAVPPVEGPCLADEATDGDDGVGEVEEGGDEVLVAFIAGLEE